MMQPPSHAALKSEGEAAPRPILRLENLCVMFRGHDGAHSAVEDLSFEIHGGETLCIVGESGSGKSVSSLSVMRLVEFGGGEITQGRILFDTGAAEPVALNAAKPQAMTALRGNDIGMIFQEPMTALNPVFTIGRQLTEGLRHHKALSREEASTQALALLAELRIPEPARRMHQYPHELSGGMRQRVVIAIALACRPRLLIADEPTTALDVTSQAEILALIDRLKREHGTAVIFITHDMAVVAQMADRVVVMKQGRKVEEGDVSQIFQAPQHPYTQALLAAVPRLGAMRGTSFPQRTQHDGHAKPEPVVGSDETLLEVDALTTRFPVKSGLMRRVVAQVHAVQDVSFTLKRGRTLALVGESGCGKSTTAQSILRLVEPTAGRIMLDGLDITALSAQELRAARRHMQMVFQDPYGSLNPQRKLVDQVAEPLWNYEWGQGHEIAARVAFLFDRVGLPQSYLQRYPHELSGGQRQRVAIARALALEPKLIVADEAVSALDVSVQAQILDLLLTLQADLGLSYLFISHDMAVVEQISHDVAVMHMGRIVEHGPRSAVFENPQHPYTQALLQAVPIADPTQRRTREKPAALTPSPIHPVGYVSPKLVYREVGEAHVALTSPSWNEMTHTPSKGAR